MKYLLPFLAFSLLISCDKPQSKFSNDKNLIDMKNADFGKYPSNYKSIALKHYKLINPYQSDTTNIKISVPKKEYAIVEDPSRIVGEYLDTMLPIGTVVYGYSLCLEYHNLKIWILIRNDDIIMSQNIKPLPFISSGHPCNCADGPSFP